MYKRRKNNENYFFGSFHVQKKQHKITVLTTHSVSIWLAYKFSELSRTELCPFGTPIIYWQGRKSETAMYAII